MFALDLKYYAPALAKGSARAFFFDQLGLEQDIPLAPGMTFRVAELKRGTITSGEGELPFAITHSPGCMLVTDLRNSQLAVM